MSGNGECEGVLPVELDRMLRDGEGARPVTLRVQGPAFANAEVEPPCEMGMRLCVRREPSKPSTKLSSAEGLPTLAANRGMEPAKLTRLVRGELDWIVMKALEKDRARRYDTANGLAADVLRYLADEPVSAGPVGAAYRARKFFRRHRAQVTMATIALALVVLGTSLYIRSIRAEQARSPRSSSS